MFPISVVIQLTTDALCESVAPNFSCKTHQTFNSVMLVSKALQFFANEVYFKFRIKCFPKTNNIQIDKAVTF